MVRKGLEPFGRIGETARFKPLEPGFGFHKFRAAVGPPFFIGSETRAGRFPALDLLYKLHGCRTDKHIPLLLVSLRA